jgi:RHS repeat-associated protein
MGDQTTSYYLGSRFIAQRKGASLSYLLQDHLGSTTQEVSSAGIVTATMKYFPFGDCLESQGTISTDKLFTGQRLDQTGLYYYGARYYDATIGRFISADTIIPNPMDPQSLNRYSYCLNNPLKYVDPSGHDGEGENATALEDYFVWIGSGYNGSDGNNVPVPQSVSELGSYTQPSTPIGQGIDPITVTLDSVALSADVVGLIPTPPTMIIGYVISTIFSVTGAVRTVFAYVDNQSGVEAYDVVVSAGTFIVGLHPVYGIFASGAQLIYDLWRGGLFKK